MNLFSNQTKKLYLTIQGLDHITLHDQYNEIIKEIDSIITESFDSNDEDIEDLGDIITILNETINRLWTNKENIKKYYDFILLRKKAKKLSNKKYRQGYNHLFGKSNYPNEYSREYWNVEDCEQQYRDLILYIWKPSSIEIKKIYHNNL